MLRKTAMVLTGLLAGAAITACGEKKSVFEESIRPITWQQVEPTNFQQMRRLSGKVQSVETASLSFQIGARVASVEASLGDRVSRGDVLATLDKQSFSLSEQSSLANLQQAQAELVKADKQHKRFLTLANEGLVSKSEYDSARAAYDAAASSVQQLQAQLQLARKDLRDTVLTAPYDGKITRRMLEPSTQVSPGEPVFEIEGDDGLEVQVMVPETLIGRLEVGKSVMIHYPVFSGRLDQGAIIEIGSQARSANAFPVTVAIQSGTEALRAGMTAEVDFYFSGRGATGHTGPIYQLPLSALKAGPENRAFVFVYHPDSQQVEERQVVIENIFNNQVQISSGLEHRDIVATAGANYLRDGQIVRLLDTRVELFN